MLSIKKFYSMMMIMFVMLFSILESPVCRFLDFVKSKKHNLKSPFNSEDKAILHFVILHDDDEMFFGCILCSAEMPFDDKTVEDKTVEDTISIIRKLMPLNILKRNKQLSSMKSPTNTHKLKYVPLIIIFWNSLMIFCKKNYNTHMNAPCGVILSFPK